MVLEIAILMLSLTYTNGHGRRQMTQFQFTYDYDYDYYYYNSNGQDQGGSGEENTVENIDSVDSEVSVPVTEFSDSTLSNGYETKDNDMDYIPYQKSVDVPDMGSYSLGQHSSNGSVSRQFNIYDYAGQCGLKIGDTTCQYTVTNDDMQQKVQDALIAMRVIGGQRAFPSRWPYLVSLRTLSGSPGDYQCSQHYCGASLIAPQLVLTAAHCIYSSSRDKRDYSGFQFVNGDTVSGPLLEEVTAELSPGCRHLPAAHKSKVAAYYHLMDFSPFRLQNDVAILVLDQPLDLPEEHYAKYWGNDDVSPSTSLTVVGWGDTSPEETISQGSRPIMPMQQGQVTVLPDDQCITALEASKLSAFFNPATMFCARDEFVDACVGDSGGPIIQSQGSGSDYELASTDYQVGIVSWGTPNGCTSSQPGEQDVGIYVELFQYLSWIDMVVFQDAPQKYNVSSPPLRYSK